MQCLQVNLCVDAGGVRMLMTQHGAYLRQRGALAQHIARQSVAKLVRSKAGSGNARAHQPVSNDRSHPAGAFKPSNRRLGTQKDPTGSAPRPPVTQIRGDCLADFGRKWQLTPAIAFAMYGELSRAPIDVVQLYRGHFTRAQSETR